MRFAVVLVLSALCGHTSTSPEYSWGPTDLPVIGNRYGFELLVIQNENFMAFFVQLRCTNFLYLNKGPGPRACARCAASLHQTSALKYSLKPARVWASSADFIKVHGLAKELGLLREQATCALRAPFVEDGPTQQNAKEMQSKRNTLNGNALREYHLYDTYMRLVESAFIYVGTLLGDAWSYGPVKRLLTLQKRAQFGQTIARAEYIRHLTSCMTLYKTLYVVRRLRSLCAHRRTTAAHKEWLKILWNYLRIFWQLRPYMRFINDGGRRQYKGR